MRLTEQMPLIFTITYLLEKMNCYLHDIDFEWTLYSVLWWLQFWHLGITFVKFPEIQDCYIPLNNWVFSKHLYVVLLFSWCCPYEASVFSRIMKSWGWKRPLGIIWSTATESSVGWSMLLGTLFPHILHISNDGDCTASCFRNTTFGHVKGDWD